MTTTLLLISGHPGAGKTHFCEWLTAERGYAHVESDVAQTLGNLAVENAVEAQAVRDAAMSQGGNVVIEWGFLPNLLPSVRLLRYVGFDAWWFDADEPTARRLWQQRRPRAELRSYLDQVERIRSAWPALAKCYRERIIRTVDSGPQFLGCDRIAERIFGGV